MEIVRCNLEQNVNPALDSKRTWLLDSSNEFELLKNRISTGFINWNNPLSLV